MTDEALREFDEELHEMETSNVVLDDDTPAVVEADTLIENALEQQQFYAEKLDKLHQLISFHTAQDKVIDQHMVDSSEDTSDEEHFESDDTWRLKSL
ncbi:hypothetical protein GEMRC1_002165 [Eukaryota sp. GEM-RC1]